MLELNAVKEFNSIWEAKQLILLKDPILYLREDLMIIIPAGEVETFSVHKMPLNHLLQMSNKLFLYFYKNKNKILLKFVNFLEFHSIYIK